MTRRSPAVLAAMRLTVKHLVNPRQMTTAGSPGAHASVIRHVGRTSGAIYETPIVLLPADGDYLVVISCGTQAELLGIDQAPRLRQP